MLINTGARVDLLNREDLLSGQSTRAVLINTGARVDVSVASHILIFALLLPRLCSDFLISVNSTTEQVAPNSTKIDVLAKFDV